VLGVSVFSLHLSILATNLVVATVVIVALCRDGALRPWQAVVSTLPFTFAPPTMSGYLLEIGGNIGPLLYVPVLWLLRRRPVIFGGLLAIGALHREFTVYAVPILLAQEAWSGELWTKRSLRKWVVAFSVAAATWQAVQALRPYADVRGPDTHGRPAAVDTGLAAATGRANIVVADLPRRAREMAGRDFQSMFGAVKADTNTAAQGHDVLFWPFTLGLAVIGVAAAIAGLRMRGAGRVAYRTAAEFPLFLVGVGLTAAIVYVLARPDETFVDRYALLALYLPIGLVSWCYVARPPRALAVLTAAVPIVMAVSSAYDHSILLSRYWGGRTPNHLRVLADELERRHVTVAMGGYWRAYKLTFMTNERVKVASADMVRIEEYQRLAAAEGSRLVVIQERPCAGGEHMDVWYLCPPASTPVPP